MPLELAALPKELNLANPTLGDPINEGYQHINLVKGVLKGTFPQIDAPVTAKAADLNNPILATARPVPAEGLGAVQEQLVPYFSGPNTAATTPITDFSKTLLALKNVTEFRALTDLSNLQVKGAEVSTTKLTIGNLSIYVDAQGRAVIAVGATKIVFNGTTIALTTDNGAKQVVVQANGELRASGDVVGFSA